MFVKTLSLLKMNKIKKAQNIIPQNMHTKIHVYIPYKIVRVKKH